MNGPPSTLPGPPPSPSLRPGAMFKLRPARGRWPFALRAAFCMGMPIFAGWVAGDIAAGLVATLGAFTALYGGTRPYSNRAVHLAIIALAFALAVSLGLWAADRPLLMVPTVALIATIAAFLCNALRVGPPGAYMFALVCAAGSGIPAGHLSVTQIGLLVLAGGSFAWLAHMAGALVSFRGPERAAVSAAAQAVERFIEAVGSPGEDAARHMAALAMHESWTVLVTHQPARPATDDTLSRLRALNRDLNLVFAGVLNVPASDAASLAAAAEKVRSLAEDAMDARDLAERTDLGHMPLGHHGWLDSLRESLRPWSPPLLVAARVGLAALIAGAAGAALGLERAYWVIAAAVLILHQGLDWVRSLQRGLERMAGTMVGLILAGVVLAIHPQGLWLVLTLFFLQFLIEMFVTRNYALAVVFITAAALTISAGGLPVPDIGHLLWVRGVDTAIGCVIGLLVLEVTMPRSVAVRVPQELINTISALRLTLRLVASGEVTTYAGRNARRDLQHRTIVLLQAYEASVGATPRHRDAAERLWPAVAAAQRLAYRVLAICWSLENAGPATKKAQTLFGPDGERNIGEALAIISRAIRTGTKAEPLPELPEFVSTEIQNLHGALVYKGQRAVR